MELKQVMGNRRSIRYFQPDKPVEKEKIQVMLEAANRASRSGNIDYWRALVVYRDVLSPDTLDALRVPTTTADLDMAPVQIYWFADMSYADPDNFRRNLKELVKVGALNPSHGWSDAYVDENVVVVGRVRRRFFHAGGATQSRTEVVADKVLPVRSKKVPDLLDTARRKLAEALS